MNVNNRKENAKCIEHKYRVREKVLLEKPGLISKLSTPHTGPYQITRTYTNGTVSIQHSIVNERINMRSLLTPYRIKNMYCPIREGSAIHCITVHSISVAIQYTLLLLVSNTTVVQWPCTVFGYFGRLVIQ